jgi:hypothetical protein
MIPINGRIVVLHKRVINQIKSADERKIPLQIGVSCSDSRPLMQNANEKL